MFSAYTSCISSLLTPHDPTINTSRVIREQRNVVHHTGGKKKTRRTSFRGDCSGAEERMVLLQTAVTLSVSEIVFPVDLLPLVSHWVMCRSAHIQTRG